MYFLYIGFFNLLLFCFVLFHVSMEDDHIFLFFEDWGEEEEGNQSLANWAVFYSMWYNHCTEEQTLKRKEEKGKRFNN